MNGHGHGYVYEGLNNLMHVYTCMSTGMCVYMNSHRKGHMSKLATCVSINVSISMGGYRHECTSECIREASCVAV